MKFIIIGSGGCVALPKSLCQCKVCKEARLKGKLYSRCGCSLYLEDISYALNYSNIKEVNTVLY